MKKTTRTVISLSLVLCMVFALSACGLATDTPMGVLTRTALALRNKDSVSLDMEIPFSITVSATILGQELSMDLPLTLDIDSKLNGGNSHSFISISSDDLGSSTTESYSEKTETSMIVYTAPYGDDKWYKTETEIDGEGVSLSDLSVTELFALGKQLKEVLENASMERSGDLYVITVPIRDIMANEYISEWIYSSVGQALSKSGSETFTEEKAAAVLALLNDSDLKLEIASDTFYPVSAGISETAIDGEALSSLLDPEEGIAAEIAPYLSNLKATISLSCAISDIGETDAASVTVPDEIREAAVESVLSAKA